MWTLIAIYALLAFGFLLCFIGKFPGQVLAYAGLLIAAFATDNHLYPVWVLIVLGVLVVVSLIINYWLAPKLAAKVHEFGKAGRIGTTIGSIISIFCIAGSINDTVAIIIFIVFPYLFAFLFEFISKKNAGEGAKRALGAYTHFAVSTLINIIICVLCLIEVLGGWAVVFPKDSSSHLSKSNKTEYVSRADDDDDDYDKDYKKTTRFSSKEDEKCSKLVDKYEKLVNKFISVQRKEDSFDYDIYEEAGELAEKISESIDDCSSELQDRFNALALKLSTAAVFGSDSNKDSEEDDDDNTDRGDLITSELYAWEGYLTNGNKKYNIVMELEAGEEDDNGQKLMSGSYRYTSQPEDKLIYLSGKENYSQLILMTDMGYERFVLVWNKRAGTMEGDWYQYADEDDFLEGNDNYSKKLEVQLTRRD